MRLGTLAIATLGSSILGVAVVLAAQVGSSMTSAAQPVATQVFEANFDSTVSSLVPTIGQMYAFLANQNAVHIAADGSGNNKLVIDDTFATSGLPTAIACTFENHGIYQFGTLTYTSEISFGASATPFATGIIVDAPQSNMAPVAGPDGDGTLDLGGEDTGVTVPANLPLDVTATYSRVSPTQNWKYLIRVTGRTPSGELVLDVAATGHLENSAGKPLVGIAFEKKAGSTGSIAIDDVEAFYSPIATKFGDR